LGDGCQRSGGAGHNGGARKPEPGAGAGSRIGPNSVESKGFYGQMTLDLTQTARLPVSWEKPLWQVWRWDFLAEVRVQEGEPLENALRRFKRKVQQEDIIKEVKRHSYYLKPGEKKRVKAALARKRNRKKARKEQD
jgi:small subunit ribosomal protein S21